jgi:hypothetical protein
MVSAADSLGRNLGSRPELTTTTNTNAVATKVTKLRGFSPRANYTDRAAATCQRS